MYIRPSKPFQAFAIHQVPNHSSAAIDILKKKSNIMKLSTLITFATTAAFATAAPTSPASGLSKRADFCGQWDNQVQGSYTIYNNLWGRDQATSGSQCTGVDGLSGSTLKWHTKWSWAGG